MATYNVDNQWGVDRPLIGGRNQRCVKLSVKSSDGGNTLTGTMTYEGEGPIGFRGTLRGDNAGSNVLVENQWGGSSAPWHPGGRWVIGTRDQQHVVKT